MKRIDIIGLNGPTGDHYMREEKQLELPLGDNVKQPPHYMLMDGELETIDLIKDRLSVTMYSKYRVNSHSLYCYGNAIKYLMRWTQKNGIEDLRKCREYLDMMIKDSVDV